MYSEVKVELAKRSRISEMPVVGLASIGFTGMPGVRCTCAGRSFSGRCCSSEQILPQSGYSDSACVVKVER